MLKRKILCVLFLIIFSVTSLVAQQKVAMRCLQISKDFLARSEWTNACAQAELGTVYDDSISDLWYVSAEAKYRSGQKPAQVLPLVITALEKNNWVDNNKDNARLLYARLLCDTNDYYGALKQLDTAPMIYSAEAEYIRILSYYHIGTEESYSKAREKLSVVSKLFPNDNRFPLVFFTQELKEDLTFDKEAAVLAQVFSKRFTNPTEKSVKNSAELFIYAAAFADVDLQERMLKAFDSAGLRHPMFAVIALKAGVLTETEAYEYFCSYASESMTLKNLTQFASLIKTDEVKDALKTFLASFNGVLSDNLHGDNCIKLIAKYERGRPQYISFDDNLDGIPEWKINCDFGSPLSVVFSDNISLTYKEYPYLSSVIADDISYSFVPNLYEWAPVKFDLNKKLEELIGENSFIVPEPLKTSFDLNQSDLIKYSSSFTCPGYERPEGKIQISTVDGIFQEAKYSSNDKVYATLSFASGLPVTRYVDADNDGYFELTEEYAYSVEEYENFDYSNVYSKLFGPVKFEPGVYLKSISIDLDFDSKQDFKTEYFPNDEKKLTWFDSNGNVFCEYKTQPSLEKSQTLFYMPETNAIVTVEMEKQIPVSVSKQNSDSKDSECLSVTESDGVYWIGNPAISDISGKVKALLEEDGRQGYSIISSYEVNEEGKKDIVTFTAIKINDLYFGVVCE